MLKSENGSVASAANNVAAADHHSSAARLCHVVKQENFDGYGFNLHAEKGKPGQYIGKVDDGSPAEAAGLRQGDRILEVNGSSILNETHKQVVQRIKAISSEVQLLVIDPVDTATTASNASSINIPKELKDPPKELSIKSEQDEKSESTVYNGSPTKVVDGPTVDEKTDQSPQAPSVNNKDPDSSSEKNFDIELPATVVETVVPSTNSSLSSLSSSTEHQNVTENQNISSTVSSTPSPTPASVTVPSVTTSSNSIVKNSSSTLTSTTTSTSEGLNLNMTAAELRAKLAAKKKFDPKNDSVDLRKKFDIIQKL